jgi:hypothetical protein
MLFLRRPKMTVVPPPASYCWTLWQDLQGSHAHRKFFFTFCNVVPKVFSHKLGVSLFFSLLFFFIYYLKRSQQKEKKKESNLAQKSETVTSS